MSALENNKHPVVLIAPPESRRVTAFQSSLRQLNWDQAKVISYQEIINFPYLLKESISNGTIVRLETSGESCMTDRLLLSLGKDVLAEPFVIQDEVKLALERGEIIPSKQWYSGLAFFYSLLQQQLADCEQHYLTVDLNETLALFDKGVTSHKWQQAGLKVPYAITDEFKSIDELITLLKQHKLSQVFIKLAHGSAASGTIALRVNGNNIKAISTIEMVTENKQIHFYNSAKLKQYTTWQQLSQLINALLLYHKLHVEVWIPKAIWQKQLFDLRVLVIAGKAQHVLMRCSDTIMTNLHLADNRRGDIEALQDQLGETKWQHILNLAQTAMLSFPNTLYAGVDILLSKGSNTPYLLEANAFGDFHPHTYYHGLDTFQAELAGLLSRENLW